MLDITELLSMIIAVVRSPKTYRVNSLQGVRLWSCLPHSITQEQARRLEKLESSGVYDLTDQSTNSISRRANRQYLQPRLLLRIAVAPISEPQNHIERLNVKRIVGDKSKKLALQGLQLLFHCEYLTLVQYVECVVPLVFIVYQLILSQLPNAAFYPHDDTDWTVATITNLVAFALMKVASFLFLSAELV
ncbi:hypothetical protein PHYSODRAFT_331538 [Phytophthora sojae]|uniref:Uncharacterized protein n=1 Tax=Phytophthora sojae (strain P6497) TaxID=1094619 RepID=G4ZHD1_PHYSP|nr:hypothetical protein PHYSODRAFT_331538 [Phytophthora sojae]EGZ17601.1 hypothetical protein PHYSODRAFT_331538 [Phytophthora sojae]|eukprot:XP_009526659.1 hypothetical protein PHYSODRAFT_331538 [Phytophthora sojae]